MIRTKLAKNQIKYDPLDPCCKKILESGNYYIIEDGDNRYLMKKEDVSFIDSLNKIE